MYYKQGNMVSAENMALKVLELEGFRRLHDEGYVEIINPMQTIALIYSKTGRTLQAIELYRNVVEKWRSRFGVEHEGTQSSMTALADVCHKNNQVSTAMQLFKEVLDVRMRLLGGEHPLTLNTLTHLD